MRQSVVSAITASLLLCGCAGDTAEPLPSALVELGGTYRLRGSASVAVPGGTADCWIHFEIRIDSSWAQPTTGSWKGLGEGSMWAGAPGQGSSVGWQGFTVILTAWPDSAASRIYDAAIGDPFQPLLDSLTVKQQDGRTMSGQLICSAAIVGGVGYQRIGTFTLVPDSTAILYDGNVPQSP